MPTQPRHAAMTISRRRFVRSAAAVSLGFSGLRCAAPHATDPTVPSEDLNPLPDDPERIIALPEGFSYTIISQQGERMSDGFYVPARHDGMATFPRPDGTTLLVRNHEVFSWMDASFSAFGADLSLVDQLDRSVFYDP